MESVCVVGAGSWGTALSTVLAGNGIGVRLYAREAAVAALINAEHRHPSRFSGLKLPGSVQALSSLAEALDGVSCAYLVVPTEYLRALVSEHEAVWQRWLTETAPAPADDAVSGDGSPVRGGFGGRVLCNCAKGLLSSPAALPDEWMREQFEQLAGAAGRFALTHLAGPNLAAEIMAGSPAAAVVASLPAESAAAQEVQRQLNCARYRVYTGTDQIGVEVAGFYKNILAIAAGAVHELGLGHNTRAALLTRGLAEMGRLVRSFGGESQTLLGLAGVGDLVVTCSSPLSRNFRAGMLRAQGLSLAQIREQMDEVAEGINACLALRQWAEAGQALPELPISDEVYRIVHEGVDPRESLLRLMTRPPREEQA
jgi:glycerol-3-phosphate dehydrogenase (NAD(P)+)